MLNDMYIAMMRGDTMSSKPSSGSYVNQIHDNITLVFEAAKAEGILAENPCDKVTPPKMDARAKKVVPSDKARAFIDSLDPSNPHELAWLIAATMGLGRGEVCGLSWGDVDFDRRVVSIRHSYDELGNLKGTEAKAGTRLLPLPDITARDPSRPRGSRPSTSSASTSRGERRERPAPSGTLSRPTRRP